MAVSKKHKKNAKKKGFFGELWEKLKPAREVMKKIWKWIKKICGFIYRFRAIFLVVITVIAAIIMASYCKANLPEQVGIDLQSDGSFAKTVSRDTAIAGPFLLTMVSLVFVLLSKKTLYPWLISLFTFAVPILILVTNQLASAI